MKRLLLPVVLLAVAASAVAGTRDSLNIGDKAPSLKHTTWLKGTPVKEYAPGKIYVVEFWATWCGPCKENIPNLTALAKKYAGQVSINGIGIWESTDRRDTTYMKRVADFVKKEGDKMDYNVAADDLAADTANEWMKAAGEGGIPMSFVIGGDGKIAWIGHAQQLEDVLAQVTAGKFNVAAAKDRRTLELEAIRPVQEAVAAKQWTLALQRIDAIVAKRPNMERYYVYDRYNATAHLDIAKTKEMSAKIISESNGEIGLYQMMSSVYASQKDLSQEAYAYGLSLIKEALAKKDREYLFLSMASGVSESLHHHDDAVTYARQAVEYADKDPHAPPPFREFLRRNLTDLANGKK